MSAPGAAGLSPGAAPSWKRIIGPVEPFLETVGKRLGEQVKAFDPALTSYAEYALQGTGKNLRPALVALAGSSLGRLKEGHTTVAVIIEMVHLATLVHDDIMDEAEMRRGRPTFASKWGTDIAVLFGDCLFAQALVLAAGFPTPEVCRAVAAATNTVCSGEIIQTRSRGNFHVTPEEYFKVLEMKTAELFALSCDLSAFLSGATSEQRQALRHFGLSFGIAYQIYDDCLDLFGSESVAGKSLGTDVAKGKLTLPVLLAWSRASAADRNSLQQIIEAQGADPDRRLQTILARYDARKSTVDQLEHFLNKARRALAILPDSAGRTGLTGLTDYLASQTAELSSPA